MTSSTAGKLLRIYLNESDRFENRPLYIAIVDALVSAGFTGATVFKGIEGFGRHKTVHAARAIDYSTDLPVVLEVVEDASAIAAFMPKLQAMAPGALITLENLVLIRVGEGSE